MRMSASSAASWCAAITGCDTSGSILKHNLRSAAGQIGGDCHQPEEKERHETGLLQIRTLLQQRSQEQAKRDAKADGWKVIQQEMQVREVHETNSAM